MLNIPAHKAIAQHWLRSGWCTPTYLMQHLPTTLQVKRSTASPSFMYSEEKQQHLLADDPTLKTDTLIHVTPADMFQRMANQNSQHNTACWHYFTSKLADLSSTTTNFESLASDWAQLKVDPRLSAAVGNPEHPSLWIGGGGTTTTAHYDVMDNVFVQMHGRKKFTLWGPEAAADLHVFPDVHPRARKSQYDDIQTLRSCKAPRQEITLEPGDTLHLPAFTFHQVEALDDVSLSINVFSVCRTQMHGGRVLSATLPYVDLDASAHTGTDRGVLFRRLAERMLVIFGIDTSLACYVKKHLLSRHRTLNGGNGVEQEDSGGSDGRGGSSVRQVAFDERSLYTLETHWKEMHKDMVESNNYTNPLEIEGVRDIVVSHLLESFALQLNDGNPKLVHATLETSCVTRDTHN